MEQGMGAPDGGGGVAPDGAGCVAPDGWSRGWGGTRWSRGWGVLDGVGGGGAQAGDGGNRVGVGGAPNGAGIGGGHLMEQVVGHQMEQRVGHQIERGWGVEHQTERGREWGTTLDQGVCVCGGGGGVVRTYSTPADCVSEHSEHIALLIRDTGLKVERGRDGEVVRTLRGSRLLYNGNNTNVNTNRFEFTTQPHKFLLQHITHTYMCKSQYKKTLMVPNMIFVVFVILIV